MHISIGGIGDIGGKIEGKIGAISRQNKGNQSNEQKEATNKSLQFWAMYGASTGYFQAEFGLNLPKIRETYILTRLCVKDQVSAVR